ncbi:Tyrosine recombinase XerD [Actinomyces bovis]|uniref:Tyrosine recombinase XerD n=1 Tax=Actinomyces bovis TaxID=1658 RepID=A0ABY1VNG3_9ACTO|nr:tyrosine-type recombinase/integrase [Actinomyces bovis]SPT53484.1 Tyrosine recombinase XerD [Actinomyces bovis]VEG55379.1 Tyrosine recombinase XerD [Actinomyces israelii]
MSASLKLVTAANARILLIGTWATTMAGQGLSERTITERTRVIAQLARDTGTDPAALTSTTLSAWLATLSTPATREAYYSIVRAWTRWLVLAGHRDDDPTIRVPRPRVPAGRPRPITDAQFDAVLALPLRRSTRAKILLAAYAGLRIHEIARIRGTDIDPITGSLHVVGKGGRDDLLPAHPVILGLAGGYPRTGYWFPSPARPGLPVRPQTVGTVISRALDRAGVRGSAHQLRHYFATALLRAGADSRVVQTLMRHSSLATTGRYLGIDPDQQRAALHLLPARPTLGSLHRAQ